ncbi:MAG: hypothetical protein HYR63_05075 [Proteobacteria bacterium]|nr:hypothetical protein [Pseudomonadota bacterium]MBI3499018.1 hypothetical protein [Pseudomonadota bacterium]
MAEPFTLDLIGRMLQQVLDEQRLMRADITDIKHRLSAVELGLAAVRTESARMQAAIDRLGERIERVERRLGILNPATT